MGSKQREGISTLMKYTAVIRQLAYDTVPGALDEYFQMGATTSRDSIKYFCKSIMEIYGLEYLQKHTYTNVEKLYRFHKEKHGFSEPMGIKNLSVNVDSRLVANQINGWYKAKNQSMIQYLEKAKTLVNDFKFSIENESCDTNGDWNAFLAVCESGPKDTKNLDPKWEGPYEVVEALGKGEYKLRNESVSRKCNNSGGLRACLARNNHTYYRIVKGRGEYGHLDLFEVYKTSSFKRAKWCANLLCGSNLSNAPSSSNSLADRINHHIHRRLWMHKAHDGKPQVAVSDLYIIALEESFSPTLLCFMAKALPTQTWLWHRRLSYLAFDAINQSSKNDIVNGLPKLKYTKDQLCSSCELGKAKRSAFKTKTVPSSKGRLHLLHMDLCGLTRVDVSLYVAIETNATMEEFVTKDRANYYSGITSITVNGKVAYELKGKFLDDLGNNAFSGTNGEDTVEHIEYFLKIVDPIDLPNVNYERLRLAVFPISLVGNASKWFDEFKGSITTWVDLTEKIFRKYYPPSRTCNVMGTEAKKDPTNTMFEEWLASKFANHMMMDPLTMEVLRDF
uniref:Retrovirus-related Pol polyprotein from transposon TNT 1-94 n=1 Tax=Tanacetum cinerariifolium TaxID=118510 RepID=A0A6L2LWC2_TANCI|nr:retrovirus-related Pol polyprotein from transposon TNT 1-94 [Tanacetum cinerariifolium]